MVTSKVHPQIVHEGSSKNSWVLIIIASIIFTILSIFSVLTRSFEIQNIPIFQVLGAILDFPVTAPAFLIGLSANVLDLQGLQYGTFFFVLLLSPVIGLFFWGCIFYLLEWLSLVVIKNGNYIKRHSLSLVFIMIFVLASIYSFVI